MILPQTIGQAANIISLTNFTKASQWSNNPLYSSLWGKTTKLGITSICYTWNQFRT